MAVFGIGSYWDGDDMTDEFINNEKACIGWHPPDAPSLYKLLKSIKTGDIIYIKSAPRGNSESRQLGS